MKIHTVNITQRMCDAVLHHGTLCTRVPGTSESVIVTEEDCENHNYHPFQISVCLVSEVEPDRYKQKNQGRYHSNQVIKIPEGVMNPEIFENEMNMDFFTLFEIKQDFHSVENGYII